MGIKIIHGNADLVGDAFRGLGEGFDKFSRQQNVDRELEDREKRTRIFDERVQSEAARMADQLRMDQEVHQAKMAEFNRQMFDIEAMRNWQRNAAQYSGPNEFAVQRQTLMDTDLPPEMKAQQMALIDMEERATMRDKAAMGYRARIGEMIRQNPEIAEQSLIAQQLADPAAMEGIAPEELPGVLHDLEQDFRLLRQQQRDDFAFAEAGQRLSKLSTDPSLGYAMQEQIPRIVEGLSDKYPPQALNNLLAGLTGEVPLSSLLDGGATEAAAREFFRSRQQEQFAQTPEGRAAIQAQAAADAGNMGLGGGGVSRGTSQVDAAQLMNEAPQSLSPRERAAVYAKIDADDAMVAEARAAAESSGRKLLADVPLERRREIMRDFYDEFPERLAGLSPDEELQAIGEYLASKGVEPHPGVVQHVAQWLTYTPEQFTATLDAMSDSPGEDPRIQEFKAYREGRANQRKKRKERVEAERAAEQQDVLNQIRALGLTEE